MITLLSDYDTIKQRNIAKHINWVLTELSVRVHKAVNRIGRTCISLVSRTHQFSGILYEVWVVARFDVLFELLNLKKTINCKVRYIYCKAWYLNIFLAHFCSLKCYKSLTNGHHACSPTPSQTSIDILLQPQKMFGQN